MQHIRRLYSANLRLAGDLEYARDNTPNGTRVRTSVRSTNVRVERVRVLLSNNGSTTSVTLKLISVRGIAHLYNGLQIGTGRPIDVHSVLIRDKFTSTGLLYDLARHNVIFGCMINSFRHPYLGV